MSVATTESDSEPTLDLTPAMGQRSGFGNLLRKELGQWWGTRQWWIQLLAWVVILNGVAALIMIDPESTANEAVQTFLLMGAFVIGVGMLLMGQFFAGMLPLALVIVTPWLLGDVATSVALGTELEFNGAIPVIATAVTTSALVLAALWRFAREEF
jgi:hypothetical protein